MGYSRKNAWSCHQVAYFSPRGVDLGDAFVLSLAEFGFELFQGR
jgi:hypothetical protein